MKRFSIVNNGYNIDEVNQFIDIVIRKLETLSRENSDYLKQVEELKKEVNKNVDVRVSQALIAAQETNDKLRRLAREEAELIIREAKDNASAIVHEALVNAQKASEEYEGLKKRNAVYRAKMESLAKAQLELCSEEKDDEE